MPHNSTPIVITRAPTIVESMGKQSVLLARDLANYISEQHLPEGTMLPNEQEMQQQFGVGRNTLREALRLLEIHGVITIRQGRGGGPMVRIPRSSDLSEELQLVLQFRGATLSDIIDARAFLEPIAAAAAAGSISPDALEQLQHSNDTLLAEGANPERFSQQNHLFHLTINECLHLPVITLILESLENVHDPLAHGIHYPPDRVRLIVRAHQRIIDRIAAGDGPGAEQMMRRHLVEAKDYWFTNFPDICAEPLRWLAD